MTEEQPRREPKSEAAHTDPATNPTPPSTVDGGSDSPWRPDDVARLHALGLPLIPMSGKRPLVKWRHGVRDYVRQPPTPDELQRWAALSPDGWAVLCGGPSRVVVLDVEAAGWNDPGPKGIGIRRIVGSLPDACLRPSPSTTDHARSSAGRPRPRSSKNNYARSNRPVLQRLIELAQLAELRAQGQYAGILGPGRGSLSVRFRPHGLTVAELSSLLVGLRSLSDVQRPLPAVGHAPGDDQRPGSRSWLDLLPAAEPCAAVLRLADNAFKLLTDDQLTPATLSPVLRLVRLAQQGHKGVPETLSLLEAEFLHRVELRGNRTGGQKAAARQWQRSVAGAITQVGPPSWLESGERRVCACWVDSLLAVHRSARPPLTSKGRARTSEALVLEHLASWTSRTGRIIVRQSQRQISLATGLRLGTVNGAISRLEGQGWLVRHKGGPRSIDGLELRIPDAITGTTRNPSPVESFVVPLVDRELHPLFGSRGLVPGALETFMRLPEYRRRLRRVSRTTPRPGTTAISPCQTPRATSGGAAAPRRQAALAASSTPHPEGAATATTRRDDHRPTRSPTVPPARQPRSTNAGNRQMVDHQPEG